MNSTRVAQAAMAMPLPLSQIASRRPTPPKAKIASCCTLNGKDLCDAGYPPNASFLNRFFIALWLMCLAETQNIVVPCLFVVVLLLNFYVMVQFFVLLLQASILVICG